MGILCPECNNSFLLTEKQATMVNTMRINGGSFLVIECPICFNHFSINPQTELNTHTEKEIVWHSPISGSHGFVTFINDGEHNFYGCSETGAVWFKKESFFKEIEEIIDKYAHRQNFYIKQGEDWLPNKSAPENIEELIDTEEKEEIINYERD